MQDRLRPDLTAVLTPCLSPCSQHPNLHLTLTASKSFAGQLRLQDLHACWFSCYRTTVQKQTPRVRSQPWVCPSRMPRKIRPFCRRYVARVNRGSGPVLTAVFWSIQIISHLAHRPAAHTPHTPFLRIFKACFAEGLQLGVTFEFQSSISKFHSLKACVDQLSTAWDQLKLH